MGAIQYNAIFHGEHILLFFFHALSVSKMLMLVLCRLSFPRRKPRKSPHLLKAYRADLHLQTQGVGVFLPFAALGPLASSCPTIQTPFPMFRSSQKLLLVYHPCPNIKPPPNLPM